MFSEKSYRKSGYNQYECSRCYGSGHETMGVFSKITCPQCNGSGVQMCESSREMEVASHRHQDENNERKNAWLFS
jgi:DnaJ-class molecular chaperone